MKRGTEHIGVKLKTGQTIVVKVEKRELGPVKNMKRFQNKKLRAQ